MPPFRRIKDRYGSNRSTDTFTLSAIYLSTILWQYYVCHTNVAKNPARADTSAFTVVKIFISTTTPTPFPHAAGVIAVILGKPKSSPRHLPSSSFSLLPMQHTAGRRQTSPTLSGHAQPTLTGPLPLFSLHAIQVRRQAWHRYIPLPGDAERCSTSIKTPKRSLVARSAKVTSTGKSEVSPRVTVSS
jgi:hypothetical protein